MSGRGRSKAPAGSATCWPSSSSPPASGSSTCQPKLAARVRLLATGTINKNDPNDARSVAVAALRSTDLREVPTEDHAAVMKVWAKRHRDLSRHRTRVACRLHAVLVRPRRPAASPPRSAQLRPPACSTTSEPDGAVAAARRELAAELVADLTRLDDSAARRETSRIAAAVEASKTTLTELFGVGPIVAATVIGDVGQPLPGSGQWRRRFASPVCRDGVPAASPIASHAPGKCR